MSAEEQQYGSGTVRLEYSTPLCPPRTLSYRLADGAVAELAAAPYPPNFEPSAYVCGRSRAPSPSPSPSPSPNFEPYAYVCGRYI